MPDAASTDTPRPWYRKPRTWYLALFALAAFLGMRKVVRQRTDFDTYLDAAREVHTVVDIYRPRGELPQYPYPHWVATLLDQLTWLPDLALKIGFGIAQGLAAVVLVRAVDRLVRQVTTIRPWHWIAFAVVFGRAFDQNFTNGQLSLWVAALTTWGIAALVDRRDTRAGAFVGTAAAMKLTPLLFLPALVAMGARHAAAAMLVTVVALVAILPWPLLGTDLHIRHLGQFHDAMIRPLFDPSVRETTVWIAGDHDIRGTLTTLLSQQVDTEGRALPNLVDLRPAAVEVVTLLWSAMVAALLGWGFLRARHAPWADRLTRQASMVMLAMVLFSPLTRVYHLVGIALPMMLFLTHGPGRGARRIGFFAITAGMLLTMPLRQKSLLGEPVWHWLHFSGVLHFSIVGLLAWLVSLPVRETGRSAAHRTPAPAPIV